MRAAICNTPNTPLRVETVELPALGSKDVRVRILASGVCHSDLSFWQGKSGLASWFPLVMGHEAVGIVTEVGPGVSRCKPGDKVLGSILPACGSCWHCIRHESQHCETTPQVGASHHVLRSGGATALTLSGLGAFAEMMQSSEDSLVPIHSDLPPEQLCLVGCGVTTGLGAALWTAQVKPGATVAIFGCGGVGQSVLQGAHLAGAERIIAIDPVALKRQMASRLGATDLVDPTACDPVAAIKEMTRGRGVDYAFEVTGIPSVTRQAFDSVRRRGITVVVGMPPNNSEITVPARGFFYDEKHLMGSLYGSAQAREHLPLIVRLAESGRLNLEALVSRTIGLDQVNEAFDAMRNGEVIRSVISFR